MDKVVDLSLVFCYQVDAPKTVERFNQFVFSG